MHRLLSDCRAATAVEFALVTPVLLMFLLGIIDTGRLMWTWNRAEKATQLGVRQAVVIDPVASGLASYSYAISGGIGQGDVVPQSAFGGVECDATACACLGEGGGSCPFGTAWDAKSFAALVTAMSGIMSEIGASNVVVDYRYSGLGFAGDPNGPDVAPLVTVSLRNLTFRPVILLGAVTFSLPSFSATLTMEGSGSKLS